MEIITCKFPVPQFAKKQLRNRKNLKQINWTERAFWFRQILVALTWLNSLHKSSVQSGETYITCYGSEMRWTQG